MYLGSVVYRGGYWKLAFGKSVVMVTVVTMAVLIIDNKHAAPGSLFAAV